MVVHTHGCKMQSFIQSYLMYISCVNAEAQEIIVQIVFLYWFSHYTPVMIPFQVCRVLLDPDSRSHGLETHFKSEPTGLGVKVTRNCVTLTQNARINSILNLFLGQSDP